MLSLLLSSSLIFYHSLACLKQSHDKGGCLWDWCNAVIFSMNNECINFLKKMKKWSSQWTQFMQLCKEAWKKKFRTLTGFEPVTSRYRCDALPTELWSHWHWEQVNCGFICSHDLFHISLTIYSKSFVPFFTAKRIQGTPLLKELCKGSLIHFVNIIIIYLSLFTKEFNFNEEITSKWLKKTTSYQTNIPPKHFFQTTKMNFEELF